MNLRRRLIRYFVYFEIVTIFIISMCFGLSYSLALRDTEELINVRTEETMDIISHGLFQSETEGLYKSASILANEIKREAIIQRETYIRDNGGTDFSYDWEAILDVAINNVSDIVVNWDDDEIYQGLFVNGEFIAVGNHTNEEVKTFAEKILDEACEEGMIQREEYPTLEDAIRNYDNKIYTSGSNPSTLISKGISYEELDPAFDETQMPISERKYEIAFFTCASLESSSFLHAICLEQSQAENEEIILSIRCHFRRALVIIIGLVCVFSACILPLINRATVSLSKPVEEEQVKNKSMLKEAEAEKDRYAEISMKKTRIISDFSHELKTPLTVISGYAQTLDQCLTDGNTDEDTRKNLHKINEEANQMAMMVNQILDITRIEEGRKVYHPADLYIDEVINATVETYFNILNKNNNKMTISVPFDLPKVYADSSMTQRILLNLLSNSLKATREGDIVISAVQKDTMVEVCVSDNGRGISKAMQNRLFERYAKGADANSTGLGLYICKNLVEEQGGTIWVESAEGKGTSVTFTLPISKECFNTVEE